MPKEFSINGNPASPEINRILNNLLDNSVGAKEVLSDGRIDTPKEASRLLDLSNDGLLDRSDVLEHAGYHQENAPRLEKDLVILAYEFKKLFSPTENKIIGLSYFIAHPSKIEGEGVNITQKIEMQLVAVINNPELLKGLSNQALIQLHDLHHRLIVQRKISFDPAKGPDIPLEPSQMELFLRENQNKLAPLLHREALSRMVRENDGAQLIDRSIKLFSQAKVSVIKHVKGSFGTGFEHLTLEIQTVDGKNIQVNPFQFQGNTVHAGNANYVVIHEGMEYFIPSQVVETIDKGIYHLLHGTPIPPVNMDVLTREDFGHHALNTLRPAVY